jgi:2-oxo-3-hexenedioate decarboxylase
LNLGDELIGLHESERLVPSFVERCADLTPEAGYAAARELHRHRIGLGWRAVGRKIGFTNRTLWPRYGVYEPMWGLVYDKTLIYAQGDFAAVALTGLAQPRIEPEICFRLKSAPRSSKTADLLASLEWVAHAVEIVQCHHPQWRLKLADCTADNGLHGRLIVGSAAAIPPNFADALPRVEVLLWQAHKLIDRGIGANVLGSPLAALGHLVDILARQPEAPPLAAGEIVTTGVLTDAHPIAAGETWRTELKGLRLPGLTLAFR